MSRHLRWGLVVALCAACGSERTLSGIWEQDGPCPAGARTPDPCPTEMVYQLNLGRFGDEVAGVLVRYGYGEDPDLNSFDGEPCDCYLLRFGTASDHGLRFKLDRCTDTDCSREHPVCGEPDAGTPGAFTNHPDQLNFALEGDSSELTGTIWCGDRPKPTTMVKDIRFKPARGRAQTACKSCTAGGR